MDTLTLLQIVITLAREECQSWWAEWTVRLVCQFRHAYGSKLCSSDSFPPTVVNQTVFIFHRMGDSSTSGAFATRTWRSAQSALWRSSFSKRSISSFRSPVVCRTLARGRPGKIVVFSWLYLLRKKHKFEATLGLCFQLTTVGVKAFPK